jgi:hypothetical protein
MRIIHRPILKVSLTILPPLVEGQGAVRLYRGRLYRSVGVPQLEPEGGVLQDSEISVGLTLQGGELRREVRKVSGEVLGSVRFVPGPWEVHPRNDTHGQRLI